MNGLAVFRFAGQLAFRAAICATDRHVAIAILSYASLLVKFYLQTLLMQSLESVH